MEKSEYRNIYRNEDSYFFYVANHKIIISLFERYKPYASQTIKILEAGCGTGLLSQKLSSYGKVTPIDLHPEAIKLSKERGLKVIKGSVNNIPFPDNCFDVVTSIDVIYHKLVDDRKAISEFFRVLKPGGIAILRVPANKWLVRQSDYHVHTRERYNAKELRQKLQKNGFILEKISYVNSPLLPAAIISYYVEKIFKINENKSPITTTPKLINWLLIALLCLESYVLRIINLPFGLGLIAVARKPNNQSKQ